MALCIMQFMHVILKWQLGEEQNNIQRYCSV